VDQLAAVIAAAPALAHCVPSAPDDGVTLVEFLIDRSGVVAAYKDSLDDGPAEEALERRVEDPSYRRCLNAEIYRLTFPAPEDGNVVVRAPFSRAKSGTLARKLSQ
jgi:hypothetical protein